MSPIPGIIASSQTGGLVTGSFESIATVTGSGSSNTVSFTSIPSGYKALQIRLIGKSTQGGSASAYVYTTTFNNDTATNYAYHGLLGNGTAASATGTSSSAGMTPGFSVVLNSASGLSNMMTTSIIDIIDYASTTKYKTLRQIIGSDTNGAGTSRIILDSGLWMSTSAINSITLTLATGSWTTTSSFALYGIK